LASNHPACDPESEGLSYVFQGYWEDIGTIRSFFEANLDVTSELPRFNFLTWARRFSAGALFAGSKINGAQIDHAVNLGWLHHHHAAISHSIVGLELVGAGKVFGGPSCWGAITTNLTNRSLSTKSWKTANRSRRQLPD